MYSVRTVILAGFTIASCLLCISQALAKDDAPAEHWAYVAPRRPAIPGPQNSNEAELWGGGAIDAFVRQKLRERGLAPSREEDAARLLRRVSLDLIGLPPSIEMLDSFLADRSPDAYERLVDGLLASPRFGEKWARQWLDLARYADSNGYQADQLRDSWAYRDWVIDALNASQPFDQFSVEQLAGDLLPNATLGQKIATGFHRTVPCNVEAGVHPEENRVQQVIDRVNTTGTVWLGSSLECAQCHDHKYDPFDQEDYYAFFAFFNNTPLEVTNGGKGVSFDFYGPKMDLPSDAATLKRLSENEETLRVAQKELGRLKKNFKAEQRRWKKETLEALRRGPVEGLPTNIAKLLQAEKQTPRQKKNLTTHFTKTRPKILEVESNIVALETEIAALRPASTLVMVEMEKARETRMFLRGSYLSPAQRVKAATPKALHPMQSDLPRDRLGMARWLVDRRNPLVARVTVNRWWAQIMGRGIVATIEDFGSQGSAPTHARLLDWLAVEFMESGWDMKHVLRLIVTSSTYRQSSRVSPALLEADPTNEYFARGPRLRLSAEAIRDNALAVCGLLSHGMGGAPVFPPQPPGLWHQTGRNEPKYEVSPGERRFRRGVYVIWRRAAPYPSFVNFDGPDRASCTPERSRTNTPLQALTLMNDEVYVEAAIALAEISLQRRFESDDRGILRHMFRRCLTRSPDARELGILERLLVEARQRMEESPGLAEKLLAGRRGLVPVAEFGSPRTKPAELAAWFRIASILLNLDETVTKG